MTTLLNRQFADEFVFSASRSSGAGGQNVNKVNTKIELRFSVFNSKLLSTREKGIILQKLSNRINDAGELIIISQAGRTQFQNKELAVAKFYELIERALTPEKKRRPTRPTKASKERRLQSKRKTSEKKAGRNYREE